MFDVGDDFTFVVEKDLYENAKPITIDMNYMGFVVQSNLPLFGGSCSTGSCSSGSCGSSSDGSCSC